MNVFVYGTLLVPKIWETVTRTGTLVSQSASLSGFEIRCVRDAVYPGIYASPTATMPVPGRVFFDVPESALLRLDAYEDDFYLRAEVFPELSDGARAAADAYLVPPEKAGTILSPHGWSLEWFEANGLEGFWGRVFSN